MAQVKAFDRARVDAQSVSSYYSEYQRPEGMADGAARVHKVKGDDRQWYVSARVADGVFTKPAKLDRIDIAAYHLGEATADQLAGKYLQKEFKTAMEKHLSQSQNVINNQSIKL